MHLYVSFFQIHYFTTLGPVAFCSTFKEIECAIICREILFSSDDFLQDFICDEWRRQWKDDT